MLNEKILERLDELQGQDDPQKYNEFIEWLFIDESEKLDLEALEMSDIPLICRMFHDKCYYFGITHDIIHIIEGILKNLEEVPDYLYNVAISIPKMKNAQDWADTIVIRILNSPEWSEEFAKVVPKLDEDSKSAVIQLLETMRKDEYEKDAADEFLKQLS